MTTPAEPVEPELAEPITVINQVSAPAQPAQDGVSIVLTVEDIDNLCEAKNTQVHNLGLQLTALQAEYEAHQAGLVQLNAARARMAAGDVINATIGGK